MTSDISLSARQTSGDATVKKPVEPHHAMSNLTQAGKNKAALESRIESQDEAPEPEIEFPEGGTQAWLVVTGAFLCIYPSAGFLVSVGAVQDYLFQHQLSDYSPADIGWISSTFIYLTLGLGIWFGPLFDTYGPKWIALGGSIGYLVMIFVLAECKEYYQFMLCLGVLGGITGAMLMTTSLACVAHWFDRRRGLAQGIAMTGASFGGLVIPLILQKTFPEYGFAWSMRIIGFNFLGCLIIGNTILKARIPPSQDAKFQFITISPYADARFSLLTASIFCLELVLLGVLGILPTYVTLSTNYPANTGSYLVSVMCGVSSIGRLTTGYISDKAGRFNTVLASAIITLIAMLVVWLPFGQHHLAALYLFIVIFGACTGCWMALIPSCLGQLCRPHDFGKYYGSSYLIGSLATLVCIPISGQFVQAVGAQAMVAFNCGVLALGSVAFAASRWACLRWKWDWTSRV